MKTNTDFNKRKKRFRTELGARAIYNVLELFVYVYILHLT